MRGRVQQKDIAPANINTKSHGKKDHTARIIWKTKKRTWLHCSQWQEKISKADCHETPQKARMEPASFPKQESQRKSGMERFWQYKLMQIEMLS